MHTTKERLIALRDRVASNIDVVDSEFDDGWNTALGFVLADLDNILVRMDMNI